MTKFKVSLVLLLLVTITAVLSESEILVRKKQLKKLEEINRNTFEFKAIEEVLHRIPTQSTKNEI